VWAVRKVQPRDGRHAAGARRGAAVDVRGLLEDDVKISINGDEHEVEAAELTYQEIVDLADSGRSKSALHSVTFKAKSGDWSLSGMVHPGQSVAISEGMVINAFVTDGA
jgi:hypothetical protein